MGIQHVHLVDLSSFTTKNTSLHGGTIGHGLVRIDATVGFLAVEEILTPPGGRNKRVELSSRSVERNSKGICG